MSVTNHTIQLKRQLFDGYVHIGSNIIVTDYWLVYYALRESHSRDMCISSISSSLHRFFPLSSIECLRLLSAALWLVTTTAEIWEMPAPGATYLIKILSRKKLVTFQPALQGVHQKVKIITFCFALVDLTTRLLLPHLSDCLWKILNKLENVQYFV